MSGEVLGTRACATGAQSLARFGGIRLEHFDATTRRDPAFAAFAQKLHVSAPPEIDQLYPRLRPARVTVTTPRGRFTRMAEEALARASCRCPTTG